MKRLKILIIGLLTVMVIASPNLVLARSKDFGEGKTHGVDEVETPWVIEVNPVDGAVNVALDSLIGFVFNIGMDRVSVARAFSITPYVFGNLSSTCTKNYSLYSKTGLVCGTTYQLSVANGARSRDGVNLAQAYTWSFTTVSCQDNDDSETDGQNGESGEQDNGSGSDGDNQPAYSDYNLTASLLSTAEIKVGDEIQVNLNILNTGDNQINVLPIEYSFDVNYLGFISSTPTPDVVADGNLKWHDLTEYFGDLAAGQTIDFVLNFLALTNTDNTIGTLRSTHVQDSQGAILDEKSSSVNIAILSSVDSGDEDNLENNSNSGSGNTSSVSSSLSSNGAGGYIPAPSAQIDYNYPAEKSVAKEYLETITVINTGGAVLTNGELILDLPADKIEFIAANPTQTSIDKNNQIIKWSISALGMDQEFSVNLVIKPIATGQAFTQVSYLTDQLDRRIDRQEVIMAVKESTEITKSQKSQNHKITQDTQIKEIQKPQEKKTMPDVVVRKDKDTAAGLPAAIEIDIDDDEINMTQSLELPPVAGEENEFIADGQEKLSGKIEVPGEVAGMITICPKCPWWVWILVIILHLVALIIYYYYTVLEEEEEVGEGAEKKISVIKGSWSWWWRILICLVIIFILFKFVCHFNIWLLLMNLVLYLAVLAIIYTLIRKADKREWVVLPVLSLAMVIVPAVICGGFGWGSWVLLGILLVLVIFNYYYFVSLIKTRRLWALLPFWLTILVFVMEVLLRWCGC